MNKQQRFSARKGWILFLVLVLVLPVSAFAVFKWYDNRLAALPYWGVGYTIQPDGPYYKVGDFHFTDQDRHVLDAAVVKDKVWVVHYFFASCPSICPRMIGNLQAVQKAYKGNESFRILSLTVDPEHDTCDVLHQYATARAIDTRQWRFGTGSKTDLYRFARKGLFIVATDGDGGPQDFIHSDKLVLIDRQMHIRGYYDGTEASEIKQLIADIKKLL
jgi:protein SCO1/2